MKIKRFLERDSRTAMARARAELGVDAVILSNKTVDGQVELVAAIDLDEADFEHSETLAERRREQGSGPAAVDAATLAGLQRELGYLRSMIEGKLSQLSWRDMAGMPSAKAALQARLAGLGLTAGLCAPMVDILPAQGDVDDYWQVVLQMLVSRLAVPEADALINKGGIVALMGATGVGKTTTIAKLAARAVLKRGRDDVALVTTDCYRVGGQEQLQIFAQYLGIPCVVATDNRELQSALAKLKSRRLVLIDTAGMSQRDPRLHQQYETLHSTGYDIDTYLVLAATAQLRTLRETVELFSSNELTGAIVTKVDEAVELGAMLEVLIERDLTLAYVCNGQQVPNDLSPAVAREFVDQAVALVSDDIAASPAPSFAERATRSAVV